MQAEAYIDGASRGNPGKAGIGVILVLENRSSQRIKQHIGIATNNEAEYYALLTALKLASGLGVERITVNSDSELLVKQIKGEYKVRSERIAQLHDAAMHLISSFKEFQIRHIPRELNMEADKLANEAVEEAGKCCE